MTETSVVLRPAKTYDAQALLTFIRQEVQSCDVVTFAPHMLQVTAAQLQTAIVTINQSVDQLLLVVEVGHEIGGYLRVASADGSATSELGLIIAANLRRQGLGGQLLDMALDWADHTGLPKLVLTVQTRNHLRLRFINAWALCVMSGVDVLLSREPVCARS